MTQIRMAGIPIDHLASEMAAAPIASAAALKLAVIELSPWLTNSTNGELDEPTVRLWRETERSLVAHAPNVSVDELIAMRDQVWFAKTDGLDPRESQTQPLHRVVRELAKRHIRSQGAVAAPCLLFDQLSQGLDADAFDKIRSRDAWRWMTFALPSDLLLAALAENDNIPVRVETLSPQLEESLYRYGFAESHLHLGAGLEFPLLWVSTMLSLRETTLAADAFKSPGAELNEGKDLGGWLLRAAIARYVLAAFLAQRKARLRKPIPSTKSKEVTSLADFIADRDDELLEGLGVADRGVLANALFDLKNGAFASKAVYAEFVSCYRRLTPPNDASGHKASTGKRLKSFLATDPINGFFPLGPDGELTSDMQFLKAGFDYAEECYRKPRRQLDELFLSLFCQVVRVRNLFYRHVVQRPMTPGLQWFVRVYGRISPGRKSLSPEMQLESAAFTSGFGRGLRALEVRTCADSKSSELFQWIEKVRDHFDDLNEKWFDGTLDGVSHYDERDDGQRKRCEFGIVLHIAKDRGAGNRDGHPNGFWLGSNADPSFRLKTSRGPEAGVNTTGYRYGHYYMTTVRGEAQAIGTVLITYPVSLEVIRGLDVCTDEVGVPSWVMAPAFRYLRDVSREVSACLSGAKYKVPPLRVSVHAGEDYVHLLTGLRNIDWAIRYLGLREGDRIGHGVALGVDATTWADSAGRVSVMREEQLFDLLFEWHCYATRQLAVPEKRRSYLDREIARLSQAVFGKSHSPFVLETFIELLHDENVLEHLGFPDGIETPILALTRNLSFSESLNEALELVKQYLSDSDVFHRSRVLEWLDPAPEAEALEGLQDYLRQRIGTLGLAVEVNVSSNLLIANLGSIESHPLFRLSPPRPNSKLRPVNLVFGSDDPITFASTLPNEFMLVHDALLSRGQLSDVEANAWLQRVQENSLRFRFTLPRPSGRKLKDLSALTPSSQLKPLL